MRIVSALALALAMGGMTMAPPALAKKASASSPKYTPAVQTGLLAAQKALDAKDTATAQSQLASAKAAIVNEDDRYMVGTLQYKLARMTEDQKLESEAIDLMLESGKGTPELQQQLYVAQGQYAYQAKDYRKAQTAMLAAQQAGSTSDDLIPVLVSSMAFNGQTTEALSTLNAAIDKQAAAGKPVPVEWYQQGIGIGYRAKGTPAEIAAAHEATTDLTKKWVAAYPTKSNWHDALRIYSEQYRVDSDTQIDVFRLLRAANAIGGDADYREYAEDVYLRFPNEAMTVLQEGNSAGIVNLNAKNGAAEVMNIVKGKVAADKASLPAAEKTARTAATGKAALSTADAYVGYGDYAKAIDLYKVAIAKGGVDAPTANLRLGQALALSGDTAGAKQAFAQVTGVRKPIADFWVVHLDHPTQG